MVTSRLALLAALSGSCGGSPAEPGPPDPPASGASVPLLIRDVQLITMTGEQVLSGRSVLVGSGVIEAIGGSELHPPAGAVVIEGRGRYLLPGLIDMHVHLNSSDLPLYPQHGITTVRNMWGWPGLIPLIARVESGELTGPRIISASQGLDDEPVQWPATVVVPNPAAAAQAVRAQRDMGWRYLKVYTRLRRDTYAAIMTEAAAAGIIPIGHVPFAVPVQEAIAMGQRSIEHLTGYDRAVSRSGNAGTGGWIDADPSRYPGLAALTASAGVWNCPTLAIYSELSKQSPPSQRAMILENRRLFVRELQRVGAPLLAGSDAGIQVVAPGTSLHDELDELVAAGLSRYQALAAATSEAGRFLAIEGLGTVTLGAPADLLLVEGNPLTDMRRLRRFDGLVQRGAWIPASR
ncbi:MAG TPA: amidohydrolase family protein [Gemmatimonadales bacterium]|nr:amidohydrolase family protein [Gemmatimonadales bacterium]